MWPTWILCALSVLVEQSHEVLLVRFFMVVAVHRPIKLSLTNEVEDWNLSNSFHYQRL